MTKGPTPKPWRERFDKKWHEAESGCHIWTAQLTKAGYGVFFKDGSGQLAHRVSWESANGPIEEGLQIDHVCHVKSCVNPDHLRPVTPKQNNENRISAQKNNVSSGLLGVRLHTPTGKYSGRVRHYGKTYCTSYFATAEEASTAVAELRRSLFTHNDFDREDYR